jgi:hypothetical protein
MKIAIYSRGYEQELKEELSQLVERADKERYQASIAFFVGQVYPAMIAIPIHFLFES